MFPGQSPSHPLLAPELPAAAIPPDDDVPTPSTAAPGPSTTGASGAPAAPVSVMVFTLDEALHLPACLDALRWCNDVIVVDSFSTDATVAIAAQWGARVVQRRFDGFGTQRNWALDHAAPVHEWVLVLDADERVTAELVEEMARALADVPPTVGAFRLRRRFYMWGRWLRYSSLYPNWVVRLVHRDRVRYVNRGHAETQDVRGEIRQLEHDLIDENLKGIDEWFERQGRYARREAEHELAQEAGLPFRWFDLVASDPLVRRAALKRLSWRLPARPVLYFVYGYVVRRGFLDGRDGFVFSTMKAIYQAMIVVKKYDARRARAAEEAAQ